MVRRIIHVDMDAFYASVETLDNPALAGKPVVVGGSPEGRGVIAAASYEARKYGLRSAMPAARAIRLCPDAVFVRPRMSRYADVSKQVFAVFHDFTPAVEGVSIDEAFLDVTGSERLLGPAEGIGRDIKARIKDDIGLTASVGIACNKFLAKIASDLEKPDGFVVIPDGEGPRVLAPLPVGRLWGVGPVTEDSLAGMGITKVADILEYPRDLLADKLGSFADRLIDLAQGIDKGEVDTGGGRKSVSSENTFASDIADEDELRGHLDAMAERVASDIRRKGLAARTISIKARYADFKTVTRSVTLEAATASTRAVRDAARELLAVRLGRGDRALRLLGVGASNLEEAGVGQATLFTEEADARDVRIDRAVDELRERFGSDAVVPGTRVEGPAEDGEEEGEDD